MESLHIDSTRLIYQAVIGVGGIGTGKFFALEGNHTLGREESRAGHFLDQRDYCKLHIITHYIQTLLGPAFRTALIGRVGDDAEGRQLIQEMSDAGLDLRHVETVSGGQTLYSFCFVYPDGTGGNMTTNDSVNATIDQGLVDQAVPLFREYQGRGIALAVPEAPLSARQRLLELATEHGFFRASSLTSLELASPEAANLLALTDLLAINLEEAATLANMAPAAEVMQIIHATIDTARQHQPDMRVSITAGKQGSWVWDGRNLNHLPAIAVEAVNTAGAGDAHFAGLIVGMTSGLTLFQSQELATLIAALSVMSSHTIHPAIDRVSLCAFVEHHALHVDESVTNLFAVATTE